MGSAPERLDTVLLWVRRDLRVADNPALTAALATAKNVVRCLTLAAISCVVLPMIRLAGCSTELVVLVATSADYMLSI